MWDNVQNYIPLSECKNGYLYKVLCRNALWGIYSEKQKGFIISRHKFLSDFLEVEYHWDSQEADWLFLGTAKPIEELCQVLWDSSVGDKLVLKALNELPTYDVEEYL